MPSRTGPEGPPRPFGVPPPPGPASPRTAQAAVLAQNRALLYGPFPHTGLTRAISDGGLLLDEHQPVRALALARIRAAGATVVRIPVDWRDIAPAVPPPGFQARDPASPAYSFARIDASVLSAVAAGLTPLLVVFHAPAFAEAPGRWPYAYPGSWAPSPAALEDFAAALARRYDGSFPDPGLPGRVLPRVKLLQAWNEPNLARYLEPQWIDRGGRWNAFSPGMYRAMLNGFYVGVKSVQPDDVVISAGVAPDGEPAGVGRMAPITFLRGLLCVNALGRRARSSCSEPAHFDVLAFHPLSVGNPDMPAPSATDVSIADAAKITTLLARARALHTALPAGFKPVWVTEINWESAPQSAQGVPPRLQALWVSRALHRLWVAGVRLVDWEFLIDAYPGVLLATPTGGTLEYARYAGLYSAGPGGDPTLARPKPFLQGFTLPFDPLRVDGAHVRVWALLMRPHEHAVLQRELRAHGGWRTIAALHGDADGVVNVLLKLRGAARLRLDSGASRSAAALVPAARSGL